MKKGQVLQFLFLQFLANWSHHSSEKKESEHYMQNVFLKVLQLALRHVSCRPVTKPTWREGAGRNCSFSPHAKSLLWERKTQLPKRKRWWMKRIDFSMAIFINRADGFVESLNEWTAMIIFALLAVYLCNFLTNPVWQWHQQQGTCINVFII